MKLNPEHHVVKGLEGQWYKILALVMAKLNVNHVELGLDDLKMVEGLCIVATDGKKGDGLLHIELMTMEEGERLAKKEQK